MECFNNSKLINIGGDPDDQFYRYKMPVIETQVTGRGNGIHTHFKNSSEVAHAIGHPEEIILKYISYELASNLNLKNNSFSGKLDDKIQDTILNYINNLVLCIKCNNPETMYEIEGKKKRIKLFSKCASCGYRCEVISDNIGGKDKRIIKGKNSDKILNCIIKYVQTNPVSLETKEKKEYNKESVLVFNDDTFD